MASDPYRNLPDYCFWRRSISAINRGAVDPVVEAKFRIGRSDKIATAGSCFAQHISRHLKASGFNYFVTETAHPLFSQRLIKDYNYGVYSARYANIYTSRQLIQLLHRAYGTFNPVEDVWPTDSGRYIDPFRPQIQPNGFASRTEYEADRAQHFKAVRALVENLDIFVFTLGLTELWFSKSDGAAFPICPGVAGGTYDPTRHGFHNLSVAEVTADLEAAVRFIRDKNSRAKFIFTVSPVPLIATAEDRSVLVSTTYSKAVLRVAVEEITRKHDYAAYFPSYEIVTGNHARGTYFEDDLRSVTQAGVTHVMRLFMEHYALDRKGIPARNEPRNRRTVSHAELMQRSAELICEEEALDRRQN